MPFLCLLLGITHASGFVVVVGPRPPRATGLRALPRPEPLYTEEAVVALCMNALAQNDEPHKNAGLEVCWSFSGDMCRAAVGGSLAAFVNYAHNPTFGSMINSESWQGRISSRINATATRGAMATVLVNVTTVDGRDRAFLWTLQQQRRPPLQDCWLVYECLALDKALLKTL